MKDSEKGGRKRKNTGDDFYVHFLKEELSRKIYAYHEKGEHFTLNDLHNYATQDLEYTMGRTNLYKIIRAMGYKYKKCNNRAILSEQSHIKALKVSFLRKYLQYLEDGQEINFIYLDETWIYKNGSQVRMWVHDEDFKANPRKVKNEGKRFTVLHAGCNLGFLDGCSFLLDSKVEDRDYHKTMNGETFMNWIVNQLLPALNKLNGKCVIIMDNAPYHSVVLDKPPTVSSKKSKMTDWLTQNKIAFNENSTKHQLWEIIRPLINTTNKKYVVDEFLSQRGHAVLRLPPYQCQYNPIELAWAFAKNYYNKHIQSQPSSKDNVHKLWRIALSNFTEQMWKNSIAHCETLIKNDWIKYMGTCSVADIPPVIISLTESDTDESDMEFSSDSETTD